MSRLEIPKYEINTREAIRNTLVKGICNTVGKLPNGAFVNFDEIVNNLKNLLNVTANKIVLENSEISKNMYPNKENK